MKLAVALIILIATGLAGAQTVTSATPKVVSIAVTTALVRDGAETRSDTLLLWNRNERDRPIGHAVKSCIKTGSGGILGNGVMSCVLVLSLPLGKVVATGIVHDVSRYTLTITGGTGVYRGARGPLFVRRVADGVRRLTFSI